MKTMTTEETSKKKIKIESELTKVLKLIAKDMENDAEEFDGKPFNGKTVAEYFGYQGAAIAALANIISSILENETKQIKKAEEKWKKY